MGRKVLKSKIYRGYDLLESTKTEDGYYTKTLDQIIDMTELMMKRHCKTLSVRIDIHNAQDAEIPMSRREITRTLENTQRNLKKALSANHLPDIHCVWVEEKAHEDRHPHYTCSFLPTAMPYRMVTASFRSWRGRFSGGPAERDLCTSAGAMRGRAA